MENCVATTLRLCVCVWKATKLSPYLQFRQMSSQLFQPVIKPLGMSSGMRHASEPLEGDEPPEAPIYQPVLCHTTMCFWCLLHGETDSHPPLHNLAGEGRAAGICRGHPGRDLPAPPPPRVAFRVDSGTGRRGLLTKPWTN